MASGAVRSLLASALFGALALGCGDEGGSDPGGGGPPGGDDPGGNGPSGAECSGEFARVMAPYAPNTTIEEWGGFMADERGLVFSVIEDTTQLSDADETYPNLILSSDLDGNIETLANVGDSFVGPIFPYGDDLYTVVGILNRDLVRLPRSGGDPVPVADHRLWAGPVSDGSKLYYAARPSFDSEGSIGDAAIYVFDPETQTSTLLSDQGETTINAIDIDDGTIYWVETAGLLSDEDYTLFSMPAAGGTPAVVMTLPNGTALGGFRVVNGVAFGNTLTESFSFEIHRTPLGGTPEVAEDDAGVPMAIAGDTIYYGSISGLTKNSLEFDDRSVIEGTRGESIYAIAVGPTDLWYALGPCIYRAPL